MDAPKQNPTRHGKNVVFRLIERPRYSYWFSSYDDLQLRRNFELSQYVFLTGATGLLGRYLVHDLMEQGHRLALLVRGSKNESSRDRIEAILQHWEKRIGKALPRPVVIEGDIRQKYLGLSPKDVKWVARNCKSIIHSAASLKFFSDGSGEPRQSNLGGTENMLSLCEAANLRDLHYVSTAYVCGLREGTILESELNLGQSFRNDYEQSKLEAETLVRNANHIDRLTVYRPAVIAGDSKTGFTNTYHGIYLYLRLMALLVPRQPIGPDGKHVTSLRLPMTGNERRNVIPIDWVSKVIANLFSKPEAHGRTFHLAPEVCLTPKLIIDSGYSYFGSTGVEYVGKQEIDPATYNSFEAEMLPSFTMYSNYETTDPTFDCSNTRKYAPELPCPTIDESIVHTYMRYGEEDRWGKRRPAVAKVAYDASKFFEQFETVLDTQTDAPKVALDITGPGGGQWTLHLRSDKTIGCEAGLCADDESTIRLPVEEFARIISERGDNANQHAIEDFFPLSFQKMASKRVATKRAELAS